jgi:hypothetical protein
VETRSQGVSGVTHAPDSRVSMPPGRELAAACAAVVVDWHRREPPLEWEVAVASFPLSGGWGGDVRGLALINCFQWHLEDECRTQYGDVARLGALKREIDHSNARRVACIDAIDERFVRELDGHAVGDGREPVALITPGNLVDRISILELKCYHAAAAGDAAEAVLEQLDDACLGLDRLVADLASARQRMKLHRTVKLYGTSG